jgi:hypothetical protein
MTIWWRCPLATMPKPSFTTLDDPGLRGVPDWQVLTSSTRHDLGTRSCVSRPLDAVSPKMSVPWARMKHERSLLITGGATKFN